MNARLLLILLLLILNTPLYAAKSRHKHPTPVRKSITLTVEQQQQDLKLCYERVAKVHPAIGIMITREQFKATYDSLYSTIKSPASDFEFSRTVGFLLRSISCGHTYVYANTVFKDSIVKYLPFQAQWAGDKLYVSRTLIDQVPSGSEIIQIGHYTIPDLFAILTPLGAGDDCGSEEGRRFHFTFRGLRHYEILHGKSDSLSVTFNNDKGLQTLNVCTVQADTFTKRITAKYKLNPDVTSIAYTDSSKQTAIWSIHAFSEKLDLFGGKFKKHISAQAAILNNPAVKNIIIDLRGNTGGTVRNEVYMLSYVMNKNFRSVKKMEVRKEAMPVMPFSIVKQRIRTWRLFHGSKGGWVSSPRHARGILKIKSLKPDKLSDRSIYVLVNGGTFSAGAQAAAKLKDAGYKLIGTTTGGAYYYNFAGVMKKQTLPASSIGYNLPFLKLTGDVKEPTPGNIAPDYVVPYSSNDLATGTDTQLQFALSLIHPEQH